MKLNTIKIDTNQEKNIVPIFLRVYLRVGFNNKTINQIFSLVFSRILMIFMRRVSSSKSHLYLKLNLSKLVKEKLVI